MNKNIIMDADLEKKIEKAFEFVNKSQFDKIFSMNKVFSEKNSCIHVYDDKPDKIVNNDQLRETLDRLPVYFSSATEKGIKKGIAVDILCAMLADPNNYGAMTLSHTNPVSALTQTVKRLPKDHYWNENSSKVIKLIMLANKNSLHGNAIMSLGYAQKIGLSIDEAKEIIDIPSNVDGSIAGYYMNRLTHAFSALDLTKPAPKLVVDVFKNVLGENPYTQNQLSTFAHLITFGFPKTDFTIDEYLGLILNKAINKLDLKTKLFDINTYFNTKEGPLDFVSLPYQTTRSLKDGISDLRRLYQNKIFEWERVDEGFWAFNPKTQKWFSFGGETKIESGHVRHEMLTVNLELLGNKLYIFHLHPEEYRVMVAPSRHDISNPLNATILGDFILGTPSRADYRLLNELNPKGGYTKAFIVHKRGITEYTANENDLIYLSEESRNIRDKVLLSVENLEITLPYPPNNAGFNTLMTDLNRRLPNSAKLRWYDSEDAFLKQNTLP